MRRSQSTPLHWATALRQPKQSATWLLHKEAPVGTKHAYEGASETEAVWAVALNDVASGARVDPVHGLDVRGFSLSSGVPVTRSRDHPH
jgi:hypothetical protein